VLFIGSKAPSRAQDPAAAELLARVPADYGVCLVINDLRGNWERFQKAPWIEAFKKSPLLLPIQQSPEMRQLRQFEEMLKKHLDVDWQTARDEILGSAVVLAYRPPTVPGDSSEEQGLLLLKAHQPDKLAQVIAKLNKVQSNSGELQELQERKHDGTTYFRRLHKKQEHYYLLEGSVLVVSNKEASLQKVIEQKSTKGVPTWLHMKTCGADKSLLALWINPRLLDPAIEKQAKTDAGPTGLLMKSFLASWQGFDAIVVSCNWEQMAELRLSLVARPRDLPEPVRAWFEEKPANSDLWKRFPGDAILTIAVAENFEKTAAALASWMAPQDRASIHDTLQRTIGALMGLDIAKDVLPNIGPGVGVCLFPSKHPKHVPQALAALAVRSKPDDAPADRALISMLQSVARFSLIGINQKLAEPIRLKFAKQDATDIHYFAHDALFPPGFQPAFALKDGCLLLASSPEGIARFQAQSEDGTTSGETVLLRFSAVQLAKVLREHREELVRLIAQKNNIPPVLANAGIASGLDALDLFDHMQLSRTQGTDYISWLLRIRPAAR
jgi:hypothetical protein